MEEGLNMHEQMEGKTTICSQGSDIVVNSFKNREQTEDSET